VLKNITSSFNENAGCTIILFCIQNMSTNSCINDV